MKDFVIDTRSQRMLELLAQGAGSKLIAKELGYQEGTMRVYLHNLYKKIGVANKTEAVVWYLGKGKAQLAAQAAPAPVPQGTDDVLGDFALGEGLYATLGVMSSFIGPYSRVWEIGQRLAARSSPPNRCRGGCARASSGRRSSRATGPSASASSMRTRRACCATNRPRT